MRTQVIPAQITTVEDKIAGNLNLTQILLLMFPAFWTTIVYVLFIPRLEVVWYKLPLVLLVMFVCFSLAIRIKGKVLLNWLVIILRYNIRPKYFVFNKNESYMRALDLPVFEKKKIALFNKATAKKQTKKQIPNFSIKDLVKLETLIADPNYSFSMKSARKGGLNVAVEQNQK